MRAKAAAAAASWLLADYGEWIAGCGVASVGRSVRRRKEGTSEAAASTTKIVSNFHAAANQPPSGSRSLHNVQYELQNLKLYSRYNSSLSRFRTRMPFTMVD